ncbi:GIY-YIG nuclease family protein [Paenibacillus sp. GP183]|uniref:GIY-YIG nuclease family protein n=1 Tax=Paenibacillus sp. GP183 TaxID=1882751 RepID=UPI0008994BD3|nr:GIY-YIG nuclease family protein [Paenibacillus sp. GP183]SEB93863.1 GIY-YIG catalytic domain-containing protein [Paenibacillus sp. GP183]
MQDFSSLYHAIQHSRVTNLKWSQLLTKHSFSKYSIPNQGGIYLFLSQMQLNGKYNVLYAGKSDDLQRRFGEHQLSLNKHIHNSKFFVYSLEHNEDQRSYSESALIHVYNPPGNTQQKLA